MVPRLLQPALQEHGALGRGPADHARLRARHHLAPGRGGQLRPDDPGRQEQELRGERRRVGRQDGVPAHRHEAERQGLRHVRDDAGGRAHAGQDARQHAGLVLPEPRGHEEGDVGRDATGVLRGRLHGDEPGGAADQRLAQGARLLAGLEVQLGGADDGARRGGEQLRRQPGAPAAHVRGRQVREHGRLGFQGAGLRQVHPGLREPHGGLVRLGARRAPHVQQLPLRHGAQGPRRGALPGPAGGGAGGRVRQALPDRDRRRGREERPGPGPKPRGGRPGAPSTSTRRRTCRSRRARRSSRRSCTRSS